MRLITAFLLMLVSASAYAQINTYVSIIPQKYFVEKIGGDKVDVKIMVAPGASPATYEPKPKQMVDMSETDLFFSVGVPFEKTWMKKLAALNKNMTVVPTDEGIKKRTVEAHNHEEEDHHGHDHSDHGGTKDPHVWLDPISVAVQADNITKALCAKSPADCLFFKANQDAFVAELKAKDAELRKILSKKKTDHFMVFHPSWGYFADRYGLEQIAVELEGKEPKPSDLKNFISLVKKLGLDAIFVQPQFSRKSAELIAKETGASVVAVDPLAYNWGENLTYAAKLISGQE